LRRLREVLRRKREEPMNRVILALLASASVAVVACSDQGGSLTGKPHTAGGSNPGESQDPSSLASGEENTQDHYQDPNTGETGITDRAAVQAENAAIGSPEVVARLHACSKLPYTSLGAVLASRGVTITKGAANAAGTLYSGGASALGIANYAGRVPEAVIG